MRKRLATSKNWASGKFTQRSAGSVGLQPLQAVSPPIGEIAKAC